jgi:enolase
VRTRSSPCRWPRRTPLRAEQRQPLYAYLAQHLLAGREAVMPVPQMNIVNGGAHANNSLDIQEFMILPVGAPNFREALRYGAEIFHTLKKLLAKRGLSTAVGDEGGFAPDLAPTRRRARHHPRGHRAGGLQGRGDIFLGLDVASSELFKDGQVRARVREAPLQRRRVHAAILRIWRQVSDRHHRGWHERGDWSGWGELTRALGKRVQLVGDDLFVTNTQNIEARH